MNSVLRIADCGLQIEIRRRIKLFLRAVPCGLLALILCSCATSKPAPTTDANSTRQFNFQTDTFAYANELTWTYSFNTNGQWTAHKRTPKPEYALHCFPIVHAARQFDRHARFDPAQPKGDDKTYRRLIRKVIRDGSSSDPIVIPGYANLHQFSAEQETLLKSECGGAWRSYLQRGNWRMVFPFSRKHQERMANQFVSALKADRLPIAHIVCFPKQTINHAVLIFGVAESQQEIRFTTYDPNNSQVPVTLTFSRTNKTFHFPQSNYFGGGPVDVYEIYHKWNY